MDCDCKEEEANVVDPTAMPELRALGIHTGLMHPQNLKLSVYQIPRTVITFVQQHEYFNVGGHTL